MITRLAEYGVRHGTGSFAPGVDSTGHVGPSTTVPRIPDGGVGVSIGSPISEQPNDPSSSATRAIPRQARLTTVRGPVSCARARRVRRRGRGPTTDLPGD